MNYYDYLRTPEWAALRETALHSARYRCQTCNSPDDLHVHHRTYERLGNERPDDVVVLCRTCHNAVHGITIGVVTRMPVAS